MSPFREEGDQYFEERSRLTGKTGGVRERFELEKI